MYTNRLLIFACMGLLSACLSAQEIASLKFTSYNKTGELVREVSKDCLFFGRLSIQDYNRSFNLPIIVPDSFVNNSNSDTCFVYNRMKPLAVGEYVLLFNQLCYDSLSRLTKFYYNGCAECDTAEFNLQIVYDSLSRPVEISDHSKTIAGKPSKICYISYNVSGNVTEVRIFFEGVLRSKYSWQVD